MPTEDWPCVHWRPSTARTFRAFSFSPRQTPTPPSSAAGSPPSESLAKSSFNVSAAAPTAAKPRAATIAPNAYDSRLAERMALLLGRLLDEDRIDARRPAHDEPGERDQQRQPAEEPRQRRSAVGDQGITREIVALRGGRRRHAGEAVDQRQDLARAGRAADVAARAVGVLHLAVTIVVAARREGMRRRDAAGEVGQDAGELGDHRALHVDVARILGREVDGHGQRALGDAMAKIRARSGFG